LKLLPYKKKKRNIKSIKHCKSKTRQHFVVPVAQVVSVAVKLNWNDLRMTIINWMLEKQIYMSRIFDMKK
jgi:hypothetical protein